MKNKEEIEEIANKLYGEYTGYHKTSFVNGYKQCQEDMTKDVEYWQSESEHWYQQAIEINVENNLPSDYKQVTGFNNPAELAAYEKGRLHEETVLLKWIKDWDGSTNSAMGELLKDKFNQLNKTKH